MEGMNEWTKDGSKPTTVTNPKDLMGMMKCPMSVVPQNVLALQALALLEGALKYGRHNYREAGVAGSIYFDATMRHIMAWWEGEDIDPDSGLPHVIKAIASLTVLMDGILNDFWIDDRPPKVADSAWMLQMNERVKELLEKYPKEVRKPPFTEKHLEISPLSTPQDK
jgi:hypothetical protein